MAHETRHTPGPLNGAVYAGSECGCRIEGSGTLPDPLRVEYCAEHASAPELAAALRDCVSLMEWHGYHPTRGQADRLMDWEDSIEAARESLRKAGLHE